MKNRNKTNMKVSSAVNRDELKVIKRKFIVMLVTMGVFVAAILVFRSTAWFTSNKDVSGNGMQMTAGDTLFEIATKGKNVRSSEIISQADSEYESGGRTEIGSTTYYKTGSTEKLLLRFDMGDSEIGPGDSGEVSLYVIPKQDGNLNVRITLDVVAYVMLDKKDSNGNIVYQKDENGSLVLDESGNNKPEQVLVKITNDMADDNHLTSSEVAEYTTAADYLKGHIMFFGRKGDTSNSDENKRYYYDMPYTAREFTKNFGEVETGRAYQIPVYWMWPNTFGQIALPDNSTGQRSGYPILNDTDTESKTLVTDYLKTNKSSVFTNYAEITDTILEAPAESANFKLLSDGYNRADFIIGTKVSYFMIEVIVEAAE